MAYPQLNEENLLPLGEPGTAGAKGLKGERKVILAQGEGAPGETGPPGPRGVQINH